MRDIELGTTFDVKFVTTDPETGEPASLSGTPAVAAYVGNSTTEITAGITLTTDFDGRTGLNNVRVVATNGNGYADNTDVALVITTGTVAGNSAVGYVIELFTIGRGASYRRLGAPVGASISADIADVESKVDDLETRLGTPSDLGSGATVAANLADIEAQTEGIASIEVGASPDVLVSTTIASLTNQTSFTLTAGSSDDDAYNGMAAILTDQSTSAQKWVCFIGDYVGSTKTVTLESEPGFTIATGDSIAIMAAGGSTSMPVPAAVDASDIRDAVGLASADLDDQLGAIDVAVDAIKGKTDFLPSATAGAAGGVFIAGTNAATTITSGLTANISGNLSGSVGSVSGNVGGTVNGLTSTAQGHVRTAVGLSSANLDTQLSGVAAIKTKTDQLTFDEGNAVNANVTHVNDVEVGGDGGTSPWGPAA
jgi:hypothetical protein